MASLMGFGGMLRNARVSQGLSYGTVSRRLRIRSDILEAIENEDFSRIPPQSYARGMIDAYAHLLHLNPSVVVDLYEQQARLYEQDSYERPRSRAERSAYTRPSRQAHDRRRSDQDASRPSRQARQQRYREDEESMRSRRSSDASRRPRSREDARADAQGASPVAGALHAAGSVAAGAAGALSNAVSSARAHHKNVDINHSIYADQHRPMFDASRGLSQGGSSRRSSRTVYSDNMMGSLAGAKPATSRAPLIIGIVLILVVLLLGSRLLFGDKGASSSASSASSSTNSMTISGLNDPGSSGTVEQETKVVPIAPTAAVFNYEVADGQDCYVEIYIDGSSKPEVATTLSGPARGTYDVTGSLEFVTSNPSALTLKLDGSVVEMNDDNNDGVYTYTVDFDEILAAWREANQQE